MITATVHHPKRQPKVMRYISHVFPNQENRGRRPDCFFPAGPALGSG